MKISKNAIQKITRNMARDFIAGYFNTESHLFDVFWDVFSSRWDFGVTDSSGTRSIHDVETVVKEVSFAKKSAVDFVTPVILATVAETACKVNGGNLSVAKIEEVVANAAANFGAGVGLAACLVRHLPSMCKEAFAVKMDAKEAGAQKG